MGLSKIFGHSSSSGSTSNSTSSRSKHLNPLKLGPESSKVDYAIGLDQTTSPTSDLAQNHYRRLSNGEPPPPYAAEEDRKSNNFATDSKTHMPDKTQAPKPGFSDTKNSAKGGEDDYAILKNRDIVVVLDDSYSMTIIDSNKPGGRSRWQQALDAFAILVAKAVDYDTDGINIVFMNNGKANMRVKTLQDLETLWSRIEAPVQDDPTPTGQILDDLLSAYKARAVPPQTSNRSRTKVPETRPKKLMIVVVTDGIATDAPEDPIIDAAKFFQKHGFPLDQLGIQFVQVGEDKAATKWLQELDTGLRSKMGEDGRDIVDTIRSDGINLGGLDLLKAMTGAVNRKQDREGEKK